MTWAEGDDMATGLRQLLDHFQEAGGGLTDAQLLSRFIAARDESSFAALVRRHGPMVLGVCRRLLHDFHHAEDAFQATFLVLARKAASVAKREAVVSWLYGVAYRTALEAREVHARRRARERPMNDVPPPAVAPPEAQDWRPLLDRELNRLPEKYRAAIVLCDLEGRTRKEAARLLRVAEGTLSSRLATGRNLLAKRLAGCGLALSGGALAVAMGQGVASAQVPAPLVNSTAQAAALVAAGQVAGVSTSAVVLMRGVMKAMLMKKMRLVVGAVVVLAAFGAVGLDYQAGGGPAAAQAAAPEKPRSELEALRKENELLKLNLQVVLEKVQAQETELRELRGRKDHGGKAPLGMLGGPPHGIGGGGLGGMMGAAGGPPAGMLGVQGMGGGGLGGMLGAAGGPPAGGLAFGGIGAEPGTGGSPLARDTSDPVKEAEAAVKALREAKDKEGQRRAADALDKAMKKLREQLK
jgi:RNA polymerase sigma factor (sigma-70 family)